MRRLLLMMAYASLLGCAASVEDDVDCETPAEITETAASSVHTLEGSIPLFSFDGQLSRRVALAELESNGSLVEAETGRVLASPLRNNANEIFAMREIECNREEERSAGETVVGFALEATALVHLGLTGYPGTYCRVAEHGGRKMIAASTRALL